MAHRNSWFTELKAGDVPVRKLLVSLPEGKHVDITWIAQDHHQGPGRHSQDMRRAGMSDPSLALTVEP